MTTFVLIPGAGSDSWHFHLLVAALEERGHTGIAVDLPADDDSAGLDEYRQAVVDAADGATDVVVVAQSMGGFTAPLVCEPLQAKLLVYVAAMVPRPGERVGDWWTNTGHGQAYRDLARREGRDPEGFDEVEIFCHDLSPELTEGSFEHVTGQSGTPFEKVWPLDALPDVPTRFVLCRDDRFFPAEFMRGMVHDRLGIVPDEIDGGHLPALHSPEVLAEMFDGYLKELA
jgi:pimeloyl-ACP methyl ester carboxylesterase